MGFLITQLLLTNEKKMIYDLPGGRTVTWSRVQQVDQEKHD